MIKEIDKLKKVIFINELNFVLDKNFIVRFFWFR